MRTPSLRTTVAALLLGAAALTSAEAHAQTAPVGADSSPAADERFRAGKALYKAGKLHEAYEAYRAAFQLKRTYDIGANLANAEAQLGKARDATEHLAFCIKHFPPTGSRAQLERVQAQFEEARRKVGAALVTVNVDGAEVLVDGVVIGRSPLEGEVYLDPGRRTLEARLDGHAPAKVTLDIARGPAHPVKLTLGDAAPQGPVGAGGPVFGAPKARSVVPGVVLGGVAGAALVTGLGLFIGGAVKRGDARAMNEAIAASHRSCVAGAAGFDARCAALDEKARAADGLHDAGVGLLVGAGAVGAAAIGYFVWRGSAVRVSPMGTGLLVSGEF